MEVYCVALMNTIIYPILLLYTSVPLLLTAQVDERALYRQFLELQVDQQFLTYCHPIRPLPDFCANSKGEYCARLREHTFTSEAEFDSIEKYVMVEDSLPPLDLRAYAGFGRGRQQMSVADSLFLLQAVVQQASRLTRIDTTLENGVRVASWNRFRTAYPDLKHGKNRHFLNVGYFRFSRASYDQAANLGVFSFLYLGGPECGYTAFCFFERSASTWEFKRIYYTGDF